MKPTFFSVLSRVNVAVFTLVTTLLISQSALAQTGVGIGIPNPDASSVLHVQPPTGIRKGLLIPRLTTEDREAISSPAKGLLVYDITLNKFCFYNGGWFTLNEMTNAAGSPNVTHTGDFTITGSTTINGSLSATAVTTGAINANSVSANSLSTSMLSVPGFSGNSLVPSGVIVMWSGSFDSVPAGWALCNGSNGTPDLRDRFIVGAGSMYAPHVVGGANSVALTVGQLPAHTHTILGQTGGDNNDNNNTSRFAGGDKAANSVDFFFSTQSQPTGNGLEHENRPPYYALAFIIKI